MSYYGREYEEYYRGIKGGQPTSQGYRESSFRGKKNHLEDIMKLLGIQIIGITVLAGCIYTFKLSGNEELSNIFYLAQDVVTQDYYFKNRDVAKKETEKNKVIKEKVEQAEKTNIKGISVPMIGSISEKKDGIIIIKGGDSVFSVLEGKVSYSNKGKVVINHGNMIESIYEDLSDIQVKQGDKVDGNELISIENKKDSSIKFGMLEKGELIDVSKIIE